MTVAELIDVLSTQKLEAQAVIVDADTGWLVTRIHVTDSKGCKIQFHNARPGMVCLWGDYYEME